MTKYIIKVTYLEGVHAGKVHYLDKTGYVVDDLLNNIWQEDAYTTFGRCKAVCTRKEEKNTAEAIFEKRQRERQIAEGKMVSKHPLYVMKKYEPYAIETVD